MPNHPSTQSVCPTCGGNEPAWPYPRPLTAAEQEQTNPCPDPFHSPDTQTEERCGGYEGRPEMVPTEQWNGDPDTEPRCIPCPGCPDCQPPPPDPQGQVEGCPDCGATDSRHYADCPRRFVVAPSDKPVRYRTKHGDFWRCANCDSTLRVGETHTCFGLQVDAPYTRLSILADALTERAEAAEAQLDQAERRAEEAKAEASEANHQANMMSRNLQAANAFAAFYRQGLEQIAEITPDENDPAHGDGGYDAGQIARSLLNPSSTSEGER